MKGPPLILASSSPRRRALLSDLGFRFRVVAPDIDETRRAGEPPARYALRLAEEKAATIAARFPQALVIAADTTVALGKRIVDKPGKSAAANAAALRALSGRSHFVHTAVALRLGTKHWRIRASTAVKFRRLTAEDIAWYVASGEGHDKAGGYAVQGLAAAFITELRGSPTAVVGLPLAELAALLARLGVEHV